MLTGDSLLYIVNHVFLPARLPQSDDHEIANDLAICDLMISSAQAFREFVDVRWTSVVKMLTDLRTLQLTGSLDEQEVLNLMVKATPGDSLIIPIRAQNACAILRRLEGSTVYESFEIDPPNTEVMATEGRLLRLFPAAALEIADNETTTFFQTEFASFLANMDVGDVDSAPATMKAKTMVKEVRDTADPHYITHLLTAILHGLPNSQPADVERIEKRVRNEIIWNNAYKPWRRSPLWLVLRVAVQTTLRHIWGSRGHTYYKAFMISLLADVLLSEDRRTLPTDLLVCMGDKVARRLRKLSDATPDLLTKKATSAIQKINALLKRRWAKIQSKQAETPPWAPQTLNLHADTEISLLSSKDYLSQRLQQSTAPLAKSIFQPSEFPRITEDVFHAPTIETLAAALFRDPYLALADVEQFAQDRLDAWVGRFRFDASACVALGKCITLYGEKAQAKYTGNPEDQSIMLLTIFQLWSALDQLVIAQHPILEDYSPEVPETLLESLLLRKSKSIQGLIHLQNYLRYRHERARVFQRGSIFTDDLTEDSFTIRYFDASDHLQQLKRNIENTAQVERDAKLKELSAATTTYESLTEQAESMEHAHSQSGWHLSNCRKCALSSRAARLTIRVHEWPLPNDELAAKATVFELQCPPVFQAWRTTTYTILFDICRPGLLAPSTVPKVETTLGAFVGLKSFRGDLSRVTYASTTKSFMTSHYSTLKVADADGTSIFVNNALKFRLFDDSYDRWVADSFSDCALDVLCTFKLPLRSPYCALQYAINSTTHSTNRPIAEQAGVPPELDLHEHVAFGTLRSGAKLQWLNIVRELRARTLSFDRHEVQVLLIQAAMQVGPTSGEELEWHDILGDHHFGVIFLYEVSDLLLSIESNWRHLITLQTLTILVGRLLVAVKEETVINLACALLKKARNIAFDWMHSLLDDLRDTDEEADLDNLMRRRICAAAATCRATYDVDPHFVEHLLSSDHDIQVLIQCAIHVHDCTPLVDLPDDLRYLLARDRRLSYSLAPMLWEKINADRRGLDKAILAIWPMSRGGKSVDHGHWIWFPVWDR